MVIGGGGALGGAVGGPGDEDAVGEDEEGEEADHGADDDEDEVLGKSVVVDLIYYGNCIFFKSREGSELAPVTSLLFLFEMLVMSVF